jgi:hypothetical protein
MTQDEFIEKARLKHGDKYDYSEVEYKNNKTKVCIICPCPEHEPFWQTPNSHLNGRGCPKCAGNVRLTKQEFIKKAREIHGDKYDYSKTEYINTDIKVCIICPEHGVFYQTPHGHLLGKGCSNCYTHNKLNLEDFIKRVREIHGDKYNYSKVEYRHSSIKVCIICPIHREFLQEPRTHLSGCGCPFCKQSNIEKMVKKYLEYNNIPFNYNQYNFEWLKLKKKLELDFYLTDYNVAIECQGRQHFIPIEHFGGEKRLKETQERDRIKKLLCEEHGVKLYYINYDDDVKEKINEILLDIKKNSPQ